MAWKRDPQGCEKYEVSRVGVRFIVKFGFRVRDEGREPSTKAKDNDTDNDTKNDNANENYEENVKEHGKSKDKTRLRLDKNEARQDMLGEWMR